MILLENPQERNLSIIFSTLLTPTSSPFFLFILHHHHFNIQLELIHHPTSGMLVLLQDNRRDDLRRMFQLFMRDSVPLKEGPRAEVFESFVSQEDAKALSARKAELAVDDAAGKKEVIAVELNCICMTRARTS